MLQLVGGCRRPERQHEVSAIHGRGRGGGRYGWADLAGYRVAVEDIAQVLPVVAPLLTRGHGWRAGRAEWPR